MDKDRLKKICELALESRNIIISEFNVIPTQKFDEEKDIWVPNSYSLFLSLKRKEEPNLKNLDDNVTYGSLAIEYSDVEYLLESLLGFECCVDFQ